MLLLLLASAAGGGSITGTLDQAIPFGIVAYGEVNKGAATVAPQFRVATTTYSSDTGADLSFALPSDLWPGDRVLLWITGPATATVTQTVGPTFAVRDTVGQSGNGSVLYTLTAASGSTGAQSDDAGDTVTFDLDQSEPWALMRLVIQNGHAQPAFFHVETSTYAAQGSDTIVATGGTPLLPNALQLTLVSYGQQNVANTNSFPSTAPLSGGGSDAIVTSVNTASASAKNRGVALYAASASPTVGAVVDTRTVALVTSANKAAINALTLTLVPATLGADGRFWNVSSMVTPSDATLDRMDILAPSTPAGGAAFPWVMYIHGGSAGDKALSVGSEDLILRLLERGTGVVSINFRRVVDASTYTGMTGVIDIHGTVRCLRGSLAALYGISASRVVGCGSSFGASLLNGAYPTSGKSYARDVAQGHSGSSEDFDAAAILFGDFNLAAIDPNFTALGISRTPQAPACNSTSGEAAAIVGTAALPYSLCAAARYDATAFPLTGSPAQDTTENTYNTACPSYHLDGRAGYTTAPHLLVAHGTTDTSIPWYQSFNPGATATEATMPGGVVQVAIANNVYTWWESVVGGHGLNRAEWRPSTAAGQTNGVQIDRIVEWLVLEASTATVAAQLVKPLPLSLTATGSVQVTGTLDKPLPFATRAYLPDTIASLPLGVTLNRLADPLYADPFDGTVYATTTIGTEGEAADYTISTQGTANADFATALTGSASIDNAVIEVAPGIILTGPFTFPVRTGAGYCDIRSTAMASFTARGTRYDSTRDDAYAFTFRNQDIADGQAFRWAATASRYWIRGWIGEMNTGSGASAIYWSSVGIASGSWPGALGDRPSKIILEKFRFTNASGRNCRRPFGVNATEVAFLDAYIDGVNYSGVESQALYVPYGAEKVKVINCYLESCGEPFASGGAQLPSGLQTWIPSDFEFRRCTFAGFPSDGSASSGTAKNLFELKSMRRLLLTGCQFRRHAAEGQDVAFVFKNNYENIPGNYQGGIDNLCDDLTVWFNHVDDVPVLAALVGAESDNGTFPTQGGRRWDLRFLLGHGFNTAPYDTILNDTTRILIVSNDLHDVVIDHWSIYDVAAQVGGVNGNVNSVVQLLVSPALVGVRPYAVTGLRVTNCAMAQLTAGVSGASSSEGNDALNDWTSGTIHWDKNALYAGSTATTYPATTYFPATQADLFPNAGGGDPSTEHTVHATYQALGTDGLDLGAIPSWVIARTGEPSSSGTLNLPVPLSLSATGSVQVTVTGTLDLPVPLALAATASVQVTGTLDLPVPLSLAATGSVQVTVTGTLDLPVPLALAATASVQVTGTLDLPVPLSLTATGSVQVTGTLDLPVPLSLAATGSVQVTGALDKPVPLAFTATISDNIYVAQLAYTDISVSALLFTDASQPALTVTDRGVPALTFEDLSMLVIDISRDYVFQVDVVQPSSTTGDASAATGIASWTAHISLTRGGATVHANLSLSLTERSATPGRYYCTYQQSDLTTHLAAYDGRYAWVVITKTGDVSTKSFKRLLAAHVDGDD